MGWLMQQGNGIGLYQEPGSGLVTVFVALTSYPNLWDEKATSAEHTTVRKSELELANTELIRQVFWKTPNFTQSRVCTFWCRTWCCLTPLGLHRGAGAAPLLGSGGAFAIWSAGYTDKSRRRLFSLFKRSAVTWKVLLFTALLTQESGRNMAALAAFLLKLFVSNLLMLTKQ